MITATVLVIIGVLLLLPSLFAAFASERHVDYWRAVGIVAIVFGLALMAAGSLSLNAYAFVSFGLLGVVEGGSVLFGLCIRRLSGRF